MQRHVKVNTLEQERLPLIHEMDKSLCHLYGIGSIFTADEALDAVENVDDLVAIGRATTGLSIC